MTIQTEVRPAVEPKVKTVGDVLRHAALIIEERGWTQGVFQSSGGELCALGAINVAATGAWHPDFEADNDVGAASVLCCFLGGGSILDFNDAPGRTAAEVVVALRAAADKADRV